MTSCKNRTAGTEQLSDNPYKLVWSDEFDLDDRPDSTKWNYEYGLLRNREAQYYTDSLKNAYIADGYLVLQSLHEEIANKRYVSKETEYWRENQEFAHYTSTSLTTQGLVQWTYGKIEVRAKLPKGVGYGLLFGCWAKILVG